MTKSNVILFGQMYAGKTSIADALVRDFGYTKVSMAAPIKELAAKAYGPIAKDAHYKVHDPVVNVPASMSGRQILQRLGSAVKTIDRHFWLRVFDSATLDGGPYVCDDGRFLIEQDFLRPRGWFVVKVDTPEQERERRFYLANGRYPSFAELEHESEREADLIQPDIVVSGYQNPPEQASAFIVEALRAI